MTVQAGTRLGPYEIVDVLGAGGMGEVWRARDTRLNREVAIKVLPESLGKSEQFLQRFEREARAISSLNHAHICTLYDVGQQDHDVSGDTISSRSSRTSTLHYLVMELIEGESLADRLQKGPLPVHDVLKYGRQIASALDAAHRRGVIHRDLKPGNVMLTKSGAKLLDFGLAKAASEGQGVVEGLTSLPTQARPLTQEGTILGTFQYMAPEQLEGLEADARTDIFALGTLLYEMASGHRAFQGESRTSLIAAIVSSQPESITKVAPMSPPALDHVIRRCLEKDPEDRWQSAQDVASELKWISEAGSQAGVAAPVMLRRKSRERLAWGVVATLLIALIALLAGYLARAPQPQKLVLASIAPPPDTSLIPFDFLGLSLSPDGTALAFVAIERRGDRKIWIREIGSGQSRPVAGTEGASYPFWSPDGRHLGFFAQGKLKRVDLRGGAPQVLADAPSGRGADWGDTDQILYAPNIRTSIYSIPAAGGTPTQVTRYDPETETTHRWPVFLPDGEHLLYVSRRRGEGGAEMGRLMLASLTGGEGRVLIEDATNSVYVPGFILHGKGQSLFAQAFDLDQLQTVGRGIPLVDRDVSLWEPKNLAVFTASDDGTVVYLPSSTRQSVLQLVDRQGRPLEPISGPEYQGSARFSPDGKKIAIVRSESPGALSDLWVHDLEFQRSSRISFGGEAEAGPVWSPDQTRIAFACSPRGVFDVCVRDLDRPGETDVLVETPNWTSPGGWSPDGSRFYFDDQHPESNYDLYVTELAGNEEPKLILRTPFSEARPVVSPDGNWLAYLSDETGIQEVFIRASSGAAGQWQISRNGGGVPRWSGDGREVFYTSADGNMMVAEIDSLSPIRIGEPQTLFTLPGEPHRDEPIFEDVAPDGQQILLNVPTTNRYSIGFQLIVNWTRLIPED
ncbi:MAG: serine/threonine-protein kinase [Acidobacteria bacterium]|nr:serine/threonine-protein kinase [Acidobacteriota bacterium]